jgi:hypothetical protein
METDRIATKELTKKDRRSGGFLSRSTAERFSCGQFPNRSRSGAAEAQKAHGGLP